MCKRIGITWGCGCKWRAWVQCPKGQRSRVNPYQCSSTRLNHSTTPTHKEFKAKRSFYFVSWCCSPECCDDTFVLERNREIDSIRARINQLARSEPSNLRDREERYVLKQRECNRMQYGFTCHVEDWVRAFKLGLWMTNLMRRDMNLPAISYAEPSFLEGYIAGQDRRGLYDLAPVFADLRAGKDEGTWIADSTIKGIQYSSVASYEYIKQRLHKARELTYVPQENPEIALDDKHAAQAKRPGPASGPPATPTAFPPAPTATMRT